MYINLNSENINSEHICCAFSDKKCKDSYELKKKWLNQEFPNGYVFRRIDERAKVFIEYGPAENAWIPIIAPNYIHIGCFWVSGKYKKNGHGKQLLQTAIETAKKQKKYGLITVAGIKKFHFMSDTKWFVRQGFEIIEELPSGFCLLALNLKKPLEMPSFNSTVKIEQIDKKMGCVVFYSNRCPYSEYHVRESLMESCKKRNIPLEIIKIETLEQAQSSPTPATIFSLFLNGNFITTDIGACMDSRFDKIVLKK